MYYDINKLLVQILLLVIFIYLMMDLIIMAIFNLIIFIYNTSTYTCELDGKFDIPIASAGE